MEPRVPGGAGDRRGLCSGWAGVKGGCPRPLHPSSERNGWSDALRARHPCEEAAAGSLSSEEEKRGQAAGSGSPEGREGRWACPQQRRRKPAGRVGGGVSAEPATPQGETAAEAGRGSCPHHLPGRSAAPASSLARGAVRGAQGEAAGTGTWTWARGLPGRAGRPGTAGWGSAEDGRPARRSAARLSCRAAGASSARFSFRREMLISCHEARPPTERETFPMQVNVRRNEVL